MEVEDFSELISPDPQIQKRSKININEYEVKDAPPRESTIHFCNQPHSIAISENIYRNKTD